MSSKPTQSLNHYYLVIIINNTDTHSLSVFYIVFYNITFLLASEYIKFFSKIVVFPIYSSFVGDFTRISAFLIAVNGNHTSNSIKNHSASSRLIKRVFHFHHVYGSSPPGHGATVRPVGDSHHHLAAWMFPCCWLLRAADAALESKLSGTNYCLS